MHILIHLAYPCNLVAVQVPIDLSQKINNHTSSLLIKLLTFEGFEGKSFPSKSDDRMTKLNINSISVYLHLPKAPTNIIWFLTLMFMHKCIMDGLYNKLLSLTLYRPSIIHWIHLTLYYCWNLAKIDAQWFLCLDHEQLIGSRNRLFTTVDLKKC